MFRSKQLRHFLQSVLILVVLVLNLAFTGSTQETSSIEPLTPARAAYELEHSKTPQEAGRKIQQQSDAFKEELKKGPKPIQSTAKEVTDNIQDVVELAGKRTQETLSTDKVTH